MFPFGVITIKYSGHYVSGLILLKDSSHITRQRTRNAHGGTVLTENRTKILTFSVFEISIIVYVERAVRSVPVCSVGGS